MFTFSVIKSEGREGITFYNIILDGDYTVDKFIKTVLKQCKSSWGDIHIEKNGRHTDSYSYSYGKLKTRFKKIPKDKKIISAQAYGGYSYMTFIVSVSD